jgi:hypothetical protein
VIRRRHTNPIPVTEVEVAAMTSDLEDAHHDAMTELHDTLTDWRDATASRRAFLIGGGAVIGGVALAASGAGSFAHAAAASVPRAVPAAKSQKLTGDLAVVALAASLENLAVGTYQAGIDAATAGKLGAVPPAVVTFAQTAQSQHKDHAAAWNGVLTGAGKKAVTGVDLTLKKTVDTAFSQVKDVPGLAQLALELENGAAATYLAAIDGVRSTDGIKVAATIQPVEMQHAAILNFLLGQYPVPDSFAKTDGARTTKDKIG